MFGVKCSTTSWNNHRVSAKLASNAEVLRGHYGRYVTIKRTPDELYRRKDLD